MPTQVPEQCHAGMGSHGVVYKGAAYRTLDGASPADTDSDGCQCTDATYPYDCPSNWLAVPEGWSLAPHDDDSIATVAAHGWGASCLALADGSAWVSANYNPPGGSCGLEDLVTCEAGG